ncbi:MAG TPA: hypothetical protein VLW06_06110 [Terriglobales bacterium]|nr:hypothetical protein [Terriglobales bacterium]
MKFTLSVCIAFAFFMASAVAQTSESRTQGTNSNPAAMSQQQNQQTGMDQTQTTANGTHEHWLKGCVESQDGQYVLKTKKGKDIALTGEDVSAHAGHEVDLKGTWEKANAMSSTSSANASTSKHAFDVTSVKMISDTCKMGAAK